MSMREFWELPLEEMLHNTGLEWFLALLDSCKGSWKFSDDLVEGLVCQKQSDSGRRTTKPLMMDAFVEYLKRLGQEVQTTIGATGASYRSRSQGEPIKRPTQGSFDCC
jgi:hypothetical protein